MLLSILSKAINNYLNLDPESKIRLQKLNGKTVSIEFLPMHFAFQCFFNDAKIILHKGIHHDAQATIRGTPLQMLGVMITKENRQRFFAEDLLIEGNAEIAKQTIELFDELEIDWEEILSHWIGDVPAYHTSRYFYKFTNWFSITKKTLVQDINEYLHEEAAYFPTPEIIKEFFNDVDGLRMDVDRMSAKFILLRSSLLASEGKSENL